MTSTVTSNEVDGGGTQTEFEKMLTNCLSPIGKDRVSEEALFSGVARERVFHFRGKKAAAAYEGYLKDAKNDAGSTLSYEECTKQALNKLVARNKLTKDEADQIYSQSFAASQLDGKTDALYDDLGKTQATAEMSAAISKAEAAIARFDAGNTPKMRSLDETPDSGGTKSIGRNGTVDGAGNFLYKPFSDIDGNILVLAPKWMSGNLERVDLTDQHGRVLESAKSTGIGFSLREYIRFKRSGSEYQSPLTIDFVLKTGGTESYTVSDSSLTWD